MTTDEAVSVLSKIDELFGAEHENTECSIALRMAINRLQVEQWMLSIGIDPMMVVQWIPCSERMPMENGTYLVTVHEWSDDKDDFPDYDYHKVMRMRFSVQEGWRVPTHSPEWINKVMHEDVIAWMPLPEPYESQPLQENSND